MKPLLSICIPTYNRAEQLKSTLDSIVVQKEFLCGDVEIVISDNCSSDDTEAVVGEYIKRFPSIIYNRNKQNVRDENFPIVLSCASGKLRKLHNDTLRLNDGSLEHLCSIVRKYEVVHPVIFFSNGNVDCSSDTLYNFERFVYNSSYFITWIGGFSIWEEDCKGIREDVSGCEKSLWQVRKTYELISKKNSGYIDSYRFGIVQDLKKKNISYGLYQVFYLNYFSFLSPYVSSGQIDVSIYELIEKDLLYNFFSVWLIEWENQNAKFEYSDSEDLLELVRSQYVDKPYWKDFSRKYRIKKLKHKIKKIINRLLGK